jgi:dolichol-phosphate mannosyltransferase
MTVELSVVIPAYNEDKCLEPLYERLTKVFGESGITYEILFVDDGSQDKTFAVLSEMAARDPHVRALRLSRNFGHQIALTAGLSHASGRAVISMDADLQHPPEMIPRLLEKWREGYQVVATIRTDTAQSGVGKTLTSSLFYRFINRLSPVRVVPGAADFRLLDRKAVDALNSIPERTRFLRGLIPWIGFRQTEIEFEAPERFAGTTKYTYRKMLHFALNGILSLSAMPLRLASIVGAIVVAIGLLYGVYVIWTAIVNPESQRGWASTILVVLLVGGAQIFFLGVIGEYLARVFDEVKGRPLYIISERAGGDGDGPT